jgi:NAD(P)-dependent dehydrogenase (short-subunit alcohol dehydrogenase family)
MSGAKPSMHGKICMVTGATAGIGEVTASALADMDATVIVVSRNETRCTATVERIKAKTGNPSVEYLVADLTSQKDIRQMVDEFKRQHNQLHVLVNNAGSFFLQRKESIDGIEATWALNHMSYFYLTKLLLDTLKSSAPARIVNVSSNAHVRERLDLEDVELNKGYSGFRAYGRSKLANLLFTYELARRLDGSGVTVNALHPGFVRTRIGNNSGKLAEWGWSLYARLSGGLTPEEGAQTSIYLASSPDVESVSGKYFVKQKAVDSNPASYDKASAKRLSEISEEMIRV